MNYQNYDEYMRSLMGYPSMRTSMSQPMSMPMSPSMQQSMPMSQPMMSPFSNMETSSDDLERMYPETYRVIYPMVCFACDNMRTTNVNEEMVDMMTDDIYDRVESDERINIDISVEVRNDGTNNEEIEENRQRPRRRNIFLRDLIRILLLRELLRRRHRFPMRPY